MSKLLVALLLSVAACTATAEPIFTQAEANDLCSVVTANPMMIAQVKIYVRALEKGMDHHHARALAEEFEKIEYLGGTFGMRAGAFSGYIWELDGIKTYDKAMTKIHTDCAKKLVEAK